MDDSTKAWLQEINAQFRRRNVPPKQRPWVAWLEWAKHSGDQLSLGDDIVKEIFGWFEQNSKAGSQLIGPMYVGAYYYDSSFWPVVIPVVFGRVQLDARESLKTMPVAMSLSLFRDRQELLDFMSVWSNCIDYAYGMDHLESRPPNAFTKELLVSGDQALQASITLLLQDRPNPSSMQSARMATEVFLKAFLAAKAGLTDEDARRKISHNLEEALRRCLAVDAQSELLSIQSSLNVFPGVGDRYKGAEQPMGILWRAYEIAQFTGATVCRALSGRDDARKTMRIKN